MYALSLLNNMNNKGLFTLCPHPNIIYTTSRKLGHTGWDDMSLQDAVVAMLVQCAFSFE